MLQGEENGAIDWKIRLTEEFKEVATCLNIVTSAIFAKDAEINAEDIVQICDKIDKFNIEINSNKSIDNVEGSSSSSKLFVSNILQLRKVALEFQRYEWLVKIMKSNYDTYVATASFLSPSRISRRQLPNVQDIPYDKKAEEEAASTAVVSASALSKNGMLISEDGKTPLVADCKLDDMEYKDNVVDIILLSIFRNLVVKNTNGVTSQQRGILGLVEQARTYMLQPGQTAERQHQMVRDTLRDLMTPILPPFYRIFMSGIVPENSFLGREYDNKQYGPWFYAPFLTSFVTPTFFGFLVGPSYPNRRKDGEFGGLVVEKCKFLQESNCKGICLHQCKLPAQQFFQDELGLSLTVTPNFDTQECQWSFGEIPLSPEDDPSFPTGCLVGCESRATIAATAGSNANVCN